MWLALKLHERRGPLIAILRRFCLIQTGLILENFEPESIIIHNCILVPGKPGTPKVTPFDDTSLNVTFQNSGYGGLPAKFRIFVRPKGTWNFIVRKL